MPSSPRYAGLALAALLLSGCPCGKEERETVQYDGGSTYAGGTRYQSSEWGGTWLHFPAGRRYRLTNTLAAIPDEVQVYLAFREDPLGDSDAGSTTTASGNAGLVEAVQPGFIQIRNDTCSEFFVRVTAEVGGGGGAAGAAGAAGGG